MRILFYAHSSTLYGANRSLINLISGLKNLRPEFKIHLILPTNSDLENILITEKIDFTIIPHKYWIYNDSVAETWKKKGFLIFKIWYWKNKWQKYFYNVFYKNDHIHFAKKFDPDIIYINSSLAPMGAVVADSIKVPFFWHHRETLNDPVTGFFLEDYSSFKNKFNNAICHIYPSKYLKNSFSKFYTGSKQSVSFNGVQFKNSNDFIQRKTSTGLIKFGIVGRINKQKGQEEVIEVFNKLILEKPLNASIIQLEVIGDGEKSYIDYLKKIVTVSEIQFKGFMPRDLIFSNLDYLIINAKNESFGRVVAEANSHGVPVLALNSGALPELIIENTNGFLFSGRRDLLTLVEKLVSSHNETCYEKLRRSSRESFENSFSIEKHVQEILDIIDELIQ